MDGAQCARDHAFHRSFAMDFKEIDMSTPRTASPAAASALREGDFIRTRSGVRLFVRDWGEGAPVLLLPGWAMSSDLWAAVMLRLNEAGLRAISYDRRGHGRSDDPGPMDYDALADDLNDVMQALDLHACTVVAHSGAGGEVVRAITRHGASRIGRIVFVGATLPAPMASETNPGGIPPEAFAAVERQLREDLEGWIDENAQPFCPGASERTIAGLAAMVQGASRRAIVAYQGEVARADFRAEFARLDLPVTIIQGDLDVSAPPALCGERMRALKPDAEYLGWTGVAHGPMVTHPLRLADAIAARAR
jgi:pimeloyl-ACP methyl ester carboxylesterase